MKSVEYRYQVKVITNKMDTKTKKNNTKHVIRKSFKLLSKRKPDKSNYFTLIEVNKAKYEYFKRALKNVKIFVYKKMLVIFIFICAYTRTNKIIISYKKYCWKHCIPAHLVCFTKFTMANTKLGNAYK